MLNLKTYFLQTIRLNLAILAYLKYLANFNFTKGVHLIT